MLKKNKRDKIDLAACRQHKNQKLVFKAKPITVNMDDIPLSSNNGQPICSLQSCFINITENMIERMPRILYEIPFKYPMALPG